jgi:hypothetical protein
MFDQIRRRDVLAVGGRCLPSIDTLFKGFGEASGRNYAAGDDEAMADQLSNATQFFTGVQKFQEVLLIACRSSILGMLLCSFLIR